jgi:hypothetical protein
MKTIILTTTLVLLSLMTISQNKKYHDSMKKNLSILDSAKKEADYLKAANGFERIALAEKKEWLPNYYAGMCYVLIAFDKSPDDIDTWCDKATGFISRADSLSKDNSEICVLQAMCASARIGVNPMARGFQYGSMANDFTKKAIALNENNPRAYFNKGQSIFYTPEAFGGGGKKAKPHFEKAVEKYKIFKPESDIHPNWGKKMAEDLLKKCDE